VFAFCFAGSSFSPASCLLICMTIETCQCHHTTSLADRHHTTLCVPVAQYTSVCIRTGLQPLIIHHSQTPSSPMKQKKPRTVQSIAIFGTLNKQIGAVGRCSDVTSVLRMPPHPYSWRYLYENHFTRNAAPEVGRKHHVSSFEARAVV
jgi:hypothetical protein